MHQLTCPAQGDYYEAVCKTIDPVRKELVACFPKDAGFDEACFKIKYDMLIIGVSWAPCWDRLPSSAQLYLRLSLCASWGLPAGGEQNSHGQRFLTPSNAS